MDPSNKLGIKDYIKKGIELLGQEKPIVEVYYLVLPYAELLPKKRTFLTAEAEAKFGSAPFPSLKSTLENEFEEAMEMLQFDCEKSGDSDTWPSLQGKKAKRLDARYGLVCKVTGDIPQLISETPPVVYIKHGYAQAITLFMASGKKRVEFSLVEKKAWAHEETLDKTGFEEKWIPVREELGFETR